LPLTRQCSLSHGEERAGQRPGGDVERARRRAARRSSRARERDRGEGDEAQADEPIARELSIGYQHRGSGGPALVGGATRIPSGLDAVCKMTTLERLSIDRLDLPKLPADIGALVNLKRLDLSFNQLTTLPPSCYELVNLEELSVHGCPLTAATKAAIAKRLPRCKLV